SQGAGVSSRWVWCGGRARWDRCVLALAVTSMLPPLRETTKASDNADFGAHSRSFRTCSPTLRVSCCHSRARLDSGWLAGLDRDGVEPSRPVREVSVHMVIPLSCSPDATHVPYHVLTGITDPHRMKLLIAAALNQRGVKPPRGVGLWQAGSVSQLLRRLPG